MKYLLCHICYYIKCKEIKIKEVKDMPEICRFRGIIISINWNDHNPPHFRATYSVYEVSVDILNLEVRDGKFSNLQLKMLLGWAAFHQIELLENWELARENKTLFKIEPLR